MPLTAALPYGEAVAAARKAEKLCPHDAGRLLNYLACYDPAAVRPFLEQLIAGQPELVASALADLDLIALAAVR